MPSPSYEGVSHDCPTLPGQVGMHTGSIIVARVQPRTSKGITDLLLLNFVWLGTPFVPLRSQQAPNKRYLGYLAG
jgi:hypothetical protein